ncbi:MAG TPA: hypothetical protein VGE34_02450 [Candidatus Saccharimonadales bacterium]
MAKKSPQKKVTKKTAAKKPTKTARPQKKYYKLSQFKDRIKVFLARRPHRSFRQTKRRDYKRSLKLPGYFSFTWYVFSSLNKRKKTYLLLLLLSSLTTMMLVGVGSQENFEILSGILRDTGTSIFEGGWGDVGKAGLLLATGITGNFSSQLTEVQQVFAVFIGLLTWLALVWLLRAQLAGQTPRLRDALYNSGAPIVSTTLLFLLLLLQALPAAIAIIAYTAAVSTGFLSSGVVAMVFFLVVFLSVVLSLYLVTSTFLALVVVTLPGMYPWRALRTAGDLVVGRRLRILLRLIWMAVTIAILWILAMIPIVLLASWLQNTFTQIASVPIVPACLVVASSAATIFAAAYVYLLYRKVVDDDSAPA